MIRTIDSTVFAEAKVYVPDVFFDERGSFKEVFSQQKYADAGLDQRWVQDSVSRSKRNVLRGMHGDPQMAKLVQCLRGRIFDVIVDARPSSATYRRWDGFTLDEDNHHQLYVPPGFAHGFLVLSDEAIVTYKQSAHYDPAREFGLRWSDPSIGIAWPLDVEPILSPKDAAW